MAEKQKFPRLEALKVAEEIYNRIKPFTIRCKIAGSLRRRKAMVGDIEVLYISKMTKIPEDLFGGLKEVSDTDCLLEDLITEGVISRRHNSADRTAWGDQIKLAIHVASGIPIDFFAATEANWFNLLVCRTGSKESNLKITTAANRKGWTWQPFTSGFKKLSSNERHAVKSEEDVFNFVGLPFRAPEHRT